MERSNGKCITEEYDWETWHGDEERRTQVFGQKALQFRAYFFEQTRRLKQDIIDAHDFQAQTSLATQLRIELSTERRLLNDRCMPIRGLGKALNNLVLPIAFQHESPLVSNTKELLEEESGQSSSEEEDIDEDDEDLARLNNEEWYLREWKPAEIDSAVDVLLGHIRGSSRSKTRRVATQLLVHLMRQHEAAISAMERAMGLFVSKAFSRSSPQDRAPESRRVLRLLGRVSGMMAERISSLGTAKKLCRMLTRKALLAITFIQAHCRYFLFRCKQHPSDVRRRLRQLHRTSIAVLRNDFRDYMGVQAHYVHHADLLAQLHLFCNLTNANVSPFCHRDRASAVRIGAHWALMDMSTHPSLRLRRLAAEGLVQLCQVEASRLDLLHAGVHQVGALLLQSEYRRDVELGMQILHALGDGIEKEEEGKRQEYVYLLCGRGRDGGVVRWLLALIQSSDESLRRSVFALLLKVCNGDALLLLGHNENPTLLELSLVAELLPDASETRAVEAVEAYRAHRTSLFLRALLATVQRTECSDDGIVVCTLQIFCKLCSTREGRHVLVKHEMGKLIMERCQSGSTLIQISRATVMMVYLYQPAEPPVLDDVVQALDEDSSVPDVAHDLLLRLTLARPNGSCYLADYIEQEDAIYCCLAFSEAFMKCGMSMAHMTASSAFICKLAVLRKELLVWTSLKTDHLLLKIAVRCMQKAINLADLPKASEGSLTLQRELRVTLSNVHSCFVSLCHLVRPSSLLISPTPIHPTAQLFLCGGKDAAWRPLLELLNRLPRISHLLVKDADKKLADASCAAAVRFMGEILPWRGVQEELLCDFAQLEQKSSRLEAKVDYLVYPKSTGRLHDGPLGEMIEHTLPVLLDMLRHTPPVSVRSASLVAISRFSFNRTAASWIFSCFHDEEKKRWFLDLDEEGLRIAAPKGLFTLAASLARTWQIRESLLHSAIPETAFFALKRSKDTTIVGEIALLFARLMNVGSLSVSSLNQRLLDDERNSLRILSGSIATKGDLRAQLSAIVSMVQLCKDIVNAAVSILASGALDAVCQVLAYAGRLDQDQEHIAVPDALVLQQGLRLLLALLQYPSLLLDKEAMQTIGRRLESVHRVLSSSESEQATEIRHLINEAADLLEQHRNRSVLSTATIREERKKPGISSNGKQVEAKMTARSDLLWTRPRSKNPRKKRVPKLPKLKNSTAELRDEKELFVDPVFVQR